MLPNIWMETRTGKPFSLTHPDPAAVDIRDIAIPLGNICRFNGHTSRFYSVAQHSVLCALLVEWMLLHKGIGVAFGTLQKLKLACLLHDAHEVYVGDGSQPMKTTLSLMAKEYGSDYEPYRELEGTVQATVRAALKLPLSNETVPVRRLETNKIEEIKVWDFVHAVDMAMLWREKYDLLTALEWTGTPTVPHVPPPKIQPWVSDVATHRFLLLYKDLSAPHARLRRFKPRLNWYDSLFEEFCALGRGRLTAALIDRICPEDMHD